MMTVAIGRLLRVAAVVSVAGLGVGCASQQGPGQVTAPPGYGKDPGSRVERLVQYCDRLTEKGELVTALGLCARAHEIDPDDPEPLLKVAALLQALNRDQAAVQTYGAVLQRHPQHHEAQYRLGKLYMKGGEAALASIHFDRAMRSKPEDPRPYNALGILRDQAGEHEAAQGLYRLALERDPGNLSVRNNLGLSLALDGKRAEAIELLAELAVDPAADQTVLRNLEAAYAARPQGQDGDGKHIPEGVPAEPVADALPAEPATVPGPAPAAGKASIKRPAGRTDPPAAEVPTPLFVPAPRSGEGAQQSDAQEPSAPSHSVILSAAERLMQPPEWADFEPGALLSEEPPPQKSPPQAGSIEEIKVEVIGLGGDSRAGVNGLAMLLLDDGTTVA